MKEDKFDVAILEDVESMREDIHSFLRILSDMFQYSGTDADIGIVTEIAERNGYSFNEDFDVVEVNKDERNGASVEDL